MESLLVSDILEFTNCDFIIVDSSLVIIDSNNKSLISKTIDEAFPYAIIKDDVKNYIQHPHSNNSSVIQPSDEKATYIFSLHYINLNATPAILILTKIKYNINDSVKRIYKELLNFPIFDEDVQHFVEVFEYILTILIKITGMDCGGIYVIDPLTQSLKLTYAKGVTQLFLQKASEYTKDSYNYQLIIQGQPQFIDYTKMDLSDDDFRKKEGIKAVAAIPIVHGNTIIGVINVGSHSTHAIPDTIKPLLEVIGQQLGILLDRFMLKSQVSQAKFNKNKTIASHDIIFQIDKDGIIKNVSSNIENIIGFSSDAIIGKNFTELIYPEDLQMVLESYERLKKHIVEPLEYRLRTKDGSYRYFLTVSEAHYDKQGNYVGLTGIGKDFHEKKIAELRLKESEEKFKTLANAVLTAIFIVQDNVMQWVNPATSHILEYSEDEIIGKPFWFFVHPEDVKLAKERASARLRGEKVISRYEARIITKSNKVKWIDFSVSTIQLNGRLAILGSASDITDRKRIEMDLKASEEKFYKAFHSSPIPMTINSYNDGVYREVNEASLKIFEYSQQEAIGRSIFDLNVFADNEEMNRFINEMRRNQKIQNFHVVFRTKSGLLKNCIINSDVFISSDEKLVISSIVDITDIIQSKQIIDEQYKELQKVNRDLLKIQDELRLRNMQLYEEKERFNRVLESIHDAVIVTDKNGIITMANNATVRLLNREYTLLVNNDIASVLNIDCKNNEPFNFSDIIDRLHSKSIIQECILQLNNKHYDIELHILPLKDHSGLITGTVIILRNITEKKKIEEQMLQTSKLESVGLLAAGIAHDFNNILTSIVGNISIVKHKMPESSELYHHIRDAENASFKAKELTGQLLTFAKGGAPVKKVTSLAAILKDTATFILRGSGIQCHFHIDDSVYLAEVDEGQIAQVIQNLVINAREAMEDHGELHITAKNIDDNDPVHAIIGNDRYIKITIQDNGPGIQSEHIEKIFDPYFTTKPHGSGLGLTVVYSIIKQHGGYIFVDSKPGAGTQFDIYLKATKKHIEMIAGDSNSITINGKGKVLVLEDDENIQFILRTMLEELGYEVDIATDGDQAFNKYLLSKESGQDYSFAIMDLTIPGKKGGKDTITQIRKIDYDFKVIVSSGYSNDPVMSNYQDYGFNGILPKPYRFEDLKQIIAAISY